MLRSWQRLGTQLAWRFLKTLNVGHGQVMSHMLPALQATSAAPPARLDDVLAGHDLPALVGIVDLYADVQQLQVLPEQPLNPDPDSGPDSDHECRLGSIPTPSLDLNTSCFPELRV